MVVAKNTAGVDTSIMFSFTTLPALGLVSIVPVAGSGLTQSFMLTYTNPSGFQNLGVVDLLINNFLDGRHGLLHRVPVPSGPNSGSVYLVDDAGDARVGRTPDCFFPARGRPRQNRDQRNGKLGLRQRQHPDPDPGDDV